MAKIGIPSHIAGMNPQRLRQKRELINLIRDFFTDDGFFELETPLLVPAAGMEVHLHAFQTAYIDHQQNSHTLFLPTSPEFALKKALGKGYERVFEIARVFRNHGESGPQHHPEFNMLEWYRPGNYMDIMDDVARLFTRLASLNFLHTPPGFSWENGVKRTTVQACFQEYAGLDLLRGMRNSDYWRQAAAECLEQALPADDTFDDIFFRVWLQLIEPHLGQQQPEIVYDYPASMAALAQLKVPERIWAERFEVYVQGIELGNAYSELIDARELKDRYLAANQEREQLGYPVHSLDHDLIRAVENMQPTGGIAVGVERLLMALTGETDIRQFFLLPNDVCR